MTYPSTASNDPKRSQKYLGARGLPVLLALLSAFVPLSTDLYLPSLPTMTEQFHVPAAETNLTLILFFIAFGIATVIWGPLSDKYGRRPILLVGLTVYAIASILCAASSNVWQLIFFRILQAAGGGAATAVAAAIVKDKYFGRKRESILALVQSMVFIAPAVAPVVGALLLRLTSWRGVFVTQGILGVIAFAGTIIFQETLESRSSGDILHTVGRLGVVLRNRSFTVLLVSFSMMSIAMMAFVSSSSYIYQDTFRLSAQVYSFFFAFNALGMILAPLIYLRLVCRFKRFSIINVCFVVMLLSGVLVCVLGGLEPWVFALAVLPSTFVASATRAPSAYLMLNQQRGDTGSVSALIGSVGTLMGSVGIIIVSFNMGHLIELIGALNIILVVLCGGLWLIATGTPSLKAVRDV